MRTNSKIYKTRQRKLLINSGVINRKILIQWCFYAMWVKSTSGWNSNGNGTDLYGFGALPGGGRYSDGSFIDLGYYGGWWSSSEGSGSYAWYRYLYYDGDGSYRFSYNSTYGFSVRCLKDN